MPLVLELAALTGIATACTLLGRSRASHYRAQREAARRAGLPFGPEPAHCGRRGRHPPNALTDTERQRVLGALCEPRFVDKAVAQASAVLLDEGTCLCSMSTMHRILRANRLAGERRRQATHPPRKKPESLAARPGQVWSWDITKLKSPTRGVYYDLYVAIDIYSRYIVAWTVAACEDSQIATSMLEEAMGVHGIPDAVHADRRTSTTSNPVAQLLLDLGVERSHSRPHVSNDNPYSEAAFKTLKYAPVFPATFGSSQDARGFCESFFAYYNHDHRYSGIGLHTPASVHHGTAVEVRRQCQITLDAAYAANPERFTHHRPEAPELPAAAWINQPSQEALKQTA